MGFAFDGDLSPLVVVGSGGDGVRPMQPVLIDADGDDYMLAGQGSSQGDWVFTVLFNCLKSE